MIKFTKGNKFAYTLVPAPVAGMRVSQDVFSAICECSLLSHGIFNHPTLILVLSPRVSGVVIDSRALLVHYFKTEFLTKNLKKDLISDLTTNKTANLKKNSKKDLIPDPYPKNICTKVEILVWKISNFFIFSYEVWRPDHSCKIYGLLILDSPISFLQAFQKISATFQVSSNKNSNKKYFYFSVVTSLHLFSPPKMTTPAKPTKITSRTSTKLAANMDTSGNANVVNQWVAACGGRHNAGIVTVNCVQNGVDHKALFKSQMISNQKTPYGYTLAFFKCEKEYNKLLNCPIRPDQPENVWVPEMTYRLANLATKLLMTGFYDYIEPTEFSVTQILRKGGWKSIKEKHIIKIEAEVKTIEISKTLSTRLETGNFVIYIDEGFHEVKPGFVMKMWSNKAEAAVCTEKALDGYSDARAVMFRHLDGTEDELEMNNKYYEEVQGVARCWECGALGHKTGEVCKGKLIFDIKKVRSCIKIFLKVSNFGSDPVWLIKIAPGNEQTPLAGSQGKLFFRLKKIKAQFFQI